MSVHANVDTTSKRTPRAAGAAAPSAPEFLPEIKKARGRPRLDGKLKEFPKHRIARLDTLVPYANNARTHSKAQIDRIAASIKEFGFAAPVLIDGKRGIIAGHGRVLAAKKLKMTAIPVIELAHLTPAQKRAYLLTDNKLALDAGWDEELLALELADLKELGFDLALTGFTGRELDSLFGTGGEGLTPAAKDEARVTCPECGHAFAPSP